MLLGKYLANLEELLLSNAVCLLALPVEGDKFEMEVWLKYPCCHNPQGNKSEVLEYLL